VKLVAKFAAGVVDTGGNFAAGVIDTVGAPWLANISVNVLIGYSAAGRKRIHEKKQKQKILWHCPFNWPRPSSSVQRMFFTEQSKNIISMPISKLSVF
jgi:hypothetical protein